MTRPILFVRDCTAEASGLVASAMLLNDRAPEGTGWDDCFGYLNGQTEAIVWCEFPRITEFVNKKGPIRKRDPVENCIQIAERREIVHLPPALISAPLPYLITPSATPVQGLHVQLEMQIASFAELPQFTKYLLYSDRADTIRVRGNDVPAPFVSVARRHIGAARTIRPSAGHYFPIRVGSADPVYGVAHLESKEYDGSFEATVLLTTPAELDTGTELTCEETWVDWHTAGRPNLRTEGTLAIVQSLRI